MNCKKRKTLGRIRLVLVLLGVLLLGLTAVSGVFAFRSPPEAPEPSIPAGTTLPEMEPATEGAPTEQPTEAWSLPETTPPMTASAENSETALLPEETGAFSEEMGIPDAAQSPRAEETAPETMPDSTLLETLPPWDETVPCENPREIIIEPPAVPALPEEAMEEVEEAQHMEREARLWKGIFFSALLLLAADMTAMILLTQKLREPETAQQVTPLREKTKMFPITVLTTKKTPAVGTLHRMGARQYQQDSMGHCAILDGRGLLAVVADGMGGLSDGEKVSQQIVMETLSLGQRLRSGQENGALYQILNQVNQDVNKALGPEGLYKSGSTMVAVLVSGNWFQWISVGDSRIYLYREGYVNQLSRDHDLLQQWMPEILEGRRSMEQALQDPNGRKVTSFIGMGQLKYVDGSRQSIAIQPGDRILLMTDGVYGSLPEEQMAEILRTHSDVRQAAQEMDRRIQLRRSPGQDNYTAMILGF